MSVDGTNSGRDRSHVATISQLIQEALDAGRSVRQLAEDSGGRIKFQTFQTLSKSPPKQFPKDSKTITGMAVALKVPESTIVLAYAKGLGIKVAADSSFALRLPPGVDAIDPAMQDAIINLTRAALRTGSGVRDNAKPPLSTHFGRNSRDDEWITEHMPRGQQL